MAIHYTRSYKLCVNVITTLYHQLRYKLLRATPTNKFCIEVSSSSNGPASYVEYNSRMLR